MTISVESLDDYELAGVVREREIAFQEALAEVAKRAATKGIPDWSERNVAAQLAMKRKDVFVNRIHLRSPEDAPPPLFRMGYEWAALSLVTVLESILKSPSRDIHMVSDFQHVGKGLWKQIGHARAVDNRRRAALDLINELDAFAKSRQRGMFFVVQRKSDYEPEDDAALAKSIERKAAGLSGALFR